MECFAAFLSYTDAQIGRLISFIDDIGELENTVIVLVSDNGASAEGGRDGSINDIRLSNLDPAGIAEMHERLDEIGGPLTHNNYPVGLDDGRQHSLPAVEARGARGRGRRSLHRLLAGPVLSQSAGAIRHQFVHAIDVFPSVLDLIGIEAPDEIEGVEQSGIDGISFTYLLGPDGASAAEQPRDATLRDVRVTSSLPPGMEGRHVPPGRSDLRRRSRSERTFQRRHLGAVPRCGGSVGVRTTSLASIRRSWLNGGALVGGGVAQSGPATRQSGSMGFGASEAG